MPQFEFKQDTFHIPPPKPATHHIVFLPGNPGCIAYYHAYLAHLASLLHPTASGSGASIFGTSYANFSGELDGPILNLQQQIEFTESVIEQYVASPGRDGDLSDDGAKKSPVRIILMGHSLGSYMGLEIVRRWRERAAHESQSLGMEIVGFVGVWPTPIWLAKSPGGRKVLPLSYFPFAIQLASFIVHFLAAVLPPQAFFRLVQYVTKFPDDPASTTASFLRSPLGVRESLTMVLDELRDIAADKWSAEVWGTASPAPGPPPTKLVFYFGNQDHYVDPALRDELIKKRGRGPGEEDAWRPIMEVDRSNVPHSFCIRDSKYAAEKTVDYILAIIGDVTG